MKDLDAPEYDPRNSSLKFMYSVPSNVKGKAKADLMITESRNAQLDENGDDEYVRAFKAKLQKQDTSKQATSSSSSSTFHENDEDTAGFHNKFNGKEEIQSDSNNIDSQSKPPHFYQSALEVELGRNKQKLMTYEEQVSRHPFLKNAPVEGDYTKDLFQLRHKPFNAVIRNVHCLRCGQWGHVSTDRECILKDHNRLDYERQLREDPMRSHLQQPPQQQQQQQQQHSQSLQTSHYPWDMEVVIQKENF
jgi:hypothetical protein